MLDRFDALRARSRSIRIPVVDIKTGQVYASIGAAAVKWNINPGNLAQMLKGKRANPTTLRYLEEQPAQLIGGAK